MLSAILLFAATASAGPTGPTAPAPEVSPLRAGGASVATTTPRGTPVEATILPGEATPRGTPVEATILPGEATPRGAPVEATILPGEADPADSLMRLANDALARGDYRRAMELFRSARSRFPKSARLGESLYLESFALYRTGDARDMTRALSTLDELKAKYPGANTRDAATLRLRICGVLARQGDSACAEDVTAAAAGRGGAGGAAGGTAGVRAGGRAGGCADDEDDERTAALNALLQMDADRAMPILTRIIARRDACSEVLRRRAVFLISQKQTAETADILLKVAKSDPDAEVREQAVFWLSQVRDERAVDMLSDILGSEGDASLKEKALFALSQHKSERANTLLRGYAEREAEPGELREKAVFWLGQRRSPENAEFLRTLFGKSTNEELREKILFSLSQQRGTGNDRWLMEIAGNTKEPIEIRKKALFWAGQTGVSMAQLAGLYATMSDRDMKEQMVFVYSQRRDPAAVDKLMEIARSEKDKELRKKAIFWLGQSRDPRAAGFLAELIDR